MIKTVKIYLTPIGRELYQLWNELTQVKTENEYSDIKNKILESMNNNTFTVNDLDLLNQIIKDSTMDNLDTKILEKVYELESAILQEKPQTLGSYINKSEIHITTQTLQKLLKYCGRYVHNLKLFKLLKDSQNVSDEFIQFIGENCPHLHEIDLYDTQVTDKGFGNLTEHFFDLHYVGLSNMQISDSTLQALGSNCPNLISVDLAFAYFTGNGIEEFAQSSPRSLEEINLSGTSVTDEGIIALAEKSPMLQSVYLNFTSITDDAVKALSDNCSQLKHLFISNTNVTDDSLKFLAAKCPWLQTIYLTNNNITDEGVKDLASGCQLLQTVYLNCMPISDLSLKALEEHCGMLQNIDFSNTAISINGLKPLIVKCPFLQSISVDSTFITEKEIASLKKDMPLIQFV